MKDEHQVRRELERRGRYGYSQLGDQTAFWILALVMVTLWLFLPLAWVFIGP